MSSRNAERIRRRRAAALALGISAALAAPLFTGRHALAAGPDDAAVAQSLFDDGRRLFAEKNYDLACAKLDESLRLDPSAGTALNLARCFEAQGRLASAWATYKRAITIGRSTGQSRQVAAAEQLVADLEPRLSRLLLLVDANVPNLRVFRGDSELGAATIGTPIAIDPGTYPIRVEAPGFEPWRGAVTVSVEGATTELRIPPLVPLRSSASQAANPTPAPAPAFAPPPDDGEVDGLFLGGIVTAGIGVVGLGIGTAFGAMTLSEAARVEGDPSLCPAKRCSPEGLAAIDAARTDATVSTASLAAGGALLAIGGALVTFSLLDDEPPGDSIATSARGWRLSLGVAPSQRDAIPELAIAIGGAW
jgi:hypothetical protein